MEGLKKDITQVIGLYIEAYAQVFSVLKRCTAQSNPQVRYAPGGAHEGLKMGPCNNQLIEH